MREFLRSAWFLIRHPLITHELLVGEWRSWRYLERQKARARSTGSRRVQCVRCGYDLTGNKSRVCPDCGAAR